MKPYKMRTQKDAMLRTVVYMAAAATLALAAAIIGILLWCGLRNITWELLSSAPSALKNTIGIFPNIINTLYIIVLTLILALPLGIGSAVYLVEYATNQKLISLITLATETLAGIPSVLFGLVGMLFFCRFCRLQTSLLAGSLTLVLMILPSTIRTAQEALRAVPQGYREAAQGLGATKWYMIRTVVLPSCVDGIVTGCILAVGRIVGESAALLFTAGIGAAVAPSLFGAMFASGGTLSVALYVYVYERAEFETGFAIAAILLLLTASIYFAAGKMGRILKQKGGES